MKLLEPIKLGDYMLKNKMAMAPMTRSRANMEGVVGSSTVLYYKQRASAGLIISEAINISEQATGSPLTPGIYTQEQINAWKKVTQVVHENDGWTIRTQDRKVSAHFEHTVAVTSNGVDVLSSFEEIEKVINK